MSIMDLEAEVDRLQRELTDVKERIVSGRLTGDLPDNFLEQFIELPDGPLEQVLRFLPAHQVVQMRYVSRRFNQIIKKSSKTMPKIGVDGSLQFKRDQSEQLIMEWRSKNDEKVKKTKSTTNLNALSELLRFMRIDGPVFFGEGLSAADVILVQLCKAWLTIRPQTVTFIGDLSQTSSDFLKKFLTKVEPFVKRLHFQDASNIGDLLLSDGLIAAAGHLDSLWILPKSLGSEQRDIPVGDETLLSLANGEKMPSLFVAMSCSNFTPAGIRAYVAKFIHLLKEAIDNNTSQGNNQLVGVEHGWTTHELTFNKCANVTPTAVRETCDDLLDVEMAAESNVVLLIEFEEVGDRLHYVIKCTAIRRLLVIRVFNEPHPSDVTVKSQQNNHEEPNNENSSDPESDENDFDDYNGYNAMDYGDEDSDLD